MAKVSVRPEDFRVDRLACTIEQLRTRYPRWSDVIVYFFTSPRHANTFQPLATENVPGGPDSEMDLRASWTLNRQKGDDYLRLLPTGPRSSAFDTVVNLQQPAEIKCRFTVADRCLLAFRFKPVRVASTGQVTLSAVIDRTGNTGSARLIEAHGDTQDVRDQLRNVATSLVTSMWFEPASTKTHIRVDVTTGSAKDDASPAFVLEVPDNLLVRVSIAK